MRVLTVIHPFGDYQRGEQIRDEHVIELIKHGENHRHVVASEIPDEAPEKSETAQPTG